MIESSNIFIKRLFSFSFGPIISSFIGFISLPVITMLIDPAEFGKASMFTLAMMLGKFILFLGFDQAYVREYNGVKNKVSLLWNSIIIPAFFSIFFIIVLILYWRFVSVTLFGSYDKIIIVVLAFSLPLQVLQRFNLLIVRMKEMGKLYSYLAVIEKVTNFVLIILFLVFYNKTFKSLIFAQITALAIYNIILLIFVRKFWSGGKTLDLLLIKRMFYYGAPLVPSIILMWLLNSIDKMALRTWSNFNEIGIYAAGFKIATLVLIFQQVFSVFWGPTAYRWYENNIDIKYFARVNSLLSSFLFFFVALLIISRNIIILLLPREYSAASQLVPFLILIPVMRTLSETTVVGINFKRKTYFHIIIAGITVTINLAGNYLLVPNYGALGAAISTGISFMLFFWLRTLISRKLWIKFPIKHDIINSLLLSFLVISTLFINEFLIEFLIVFGVLLYNCRNLRTLFIKVTTVFSELIVNKTS